MTDDELIKHAAKAAGVCLHPEDKLRRSYGNWGCDTTCMVCNRDPCEATWYPLTNDGDALRLAVKLELDIFYSCISVRVIHRDDDGTGAVIRCKGKTPQIEDPYAATRRAIVRAAAEIGRTKCPEI